MKAYVFSIGERTTDLCVEQMKKLGFEVKLLEGPTSLWYKLREFYTLAWDSGEPEFVRIDADIIPNRGVLDLIKLQDNCLWHCGVGWDWYKQARGPISIHHMKREAIGRCLENIDLAMNENRPETFLWRTEEFHWPRVCHLVDISCGIHGYGQKDQRDRIKKLKHSRNQDYDWELIDKIEAL